MLVIVYDLIKCNMQRLCVSLFYSKQFSSFLRAVSHFAGDLQLLTSLVRRWWRLKDEATKGHLFLSGIRITRFRHLCVSTILKVKKSRLKPSLEVPNQMAIARPQCWLSILFIRCSHIPDPPLVKLYLHLNSSKSIKPLPLVQHFALLSTQIENSVLPWHSARSIGCCGFDIGKVSLN